MSKAQIRRARQLVKDGTMTQAEFDREMGATQNSDGLPDRAVPKGRRRARKVIRWKQP